MRWFKRKKLFTQMAILLFVSAVIIVLMVANMFRQLRLQMAEQEKGYVEGVVTQLSQNIQQNYTALSRIMHLISFNRDVQNFLLSTDATNRLLSFYRIESLLSDISNLNNYIIDIAIVDKAGMRYNLSDNNIYKIPEMKLTDTQADVSSRMIHAYYGEEIPYMVMGQEIYSIDSYTQTNSRIGSIYLILMPEAVTGGEYTADISESSLIQLRDMEKNVLWSSNVGDIDTFRKTAILTQEEQTAIEGLSIEVYHREQMLQDSLRRSIRPVTLVYLLPLVILAVLWGIWIRILMKPMHSLAGFLEGFEDSGLEGLKARVQLSGYQEIALVSRRINEMLERIQNLTGVVMDKTREVYQSQLEARQAEISYLRSQINPHFLYNTLETMRGLAYSENQPYLAEITKALGVIFKYSIKGKDMVSLKDELKIAKSYLFIQNARFPSRFSTEYQVEEACLLQSVPKMILQPLIENAITHGIEEKEELCHLLIGAHICDNYLQIEIADDGVGIPSDTLEVLRAQLEAAGRLKNGEETGHIGIANVHNRIRLLYGEPYGLKIESQQGRGTRITILLPLMEQRSMDRIETGL